MKKLLCCTVILSLILFALAACGGGSTPAPAEPVTIPTPDVQTNYNITASPPAQPAGDGADSGDKYGGVVKLIDTGDFGEPFGLVWQPIIARHFSTNFAEDLVNFTMSGVYEPWLANTWDIDLDKKTITFELKEGIKFTDGSPFNAEAVQWNLDSWHEDNRGNEEVGPGMTRVIDEYTVEVSFRNWQNVLFETFASHTYAMVSMENYQKNGKEYARQNPVGTGPFKLKEWNIGSSVIFERNENYWGEGMPYLDGVEYYAITDVLVQNAALMSNDPKDRIDYFGISNAEQAWTLMNAGIDFDYSYMRGSGSWILCPNSVDEKDNPFYDVRVRNAISYAIDREALCEAKGFGIWKPAAQLTSPGFAGRLDPGNPYLELATYNPEKAKQLLADAGYPNGFTTALRSNAQFQDQIVAVADMLGQVGINCELEFPDPGRLTDLQYNGWDGIMAFNWGQVMNTGISFYIWWHPDRTSYVSCMRPDEYEDMYYIARRSYDIDNDLFGALDELALKYQAFVPVYHNNTTYFIRNGLTDGGFKEYSADTMWTPWRAYWAK
ncbi:MAG: ABC transporter substrate-binding protein [Clostridiales bacterium]|nr:ABC transporter substrate-binding protein [Clostridiales bacterium]